MRHRGALRCTGLFLLALLLGGCGDEKAPDHGLASRPLASAPHGGAVDVTYAVHDGDAWRAEIRMQTDVFQKGVEGGRKRDGTARLDATLEDTWVFEQPEAGAPLTSRIELRYTHAEGTSAKGLLARAPLTGRLAHDAHRRPAPASLRMSGGTREAQEQMLDIVGSLLLAGYGGAPPWLPPHPVREGESWSLTPFVHLRAVSNIRRRAYDLGVSAPEPVFRGTVRLHSIRREGTEVLLDLELDAMVEISGTFRKDGRTGTMSAGNHFQGTATVDAKTGVPRRFDVTHVNKMNVRSAGDELKIGGTTTVHAAVERIAPRR